ncbi:MAG: tetratricopeptide repeat protein, partial [Deltaproteobacteria bacterium]|nr:tetratricopeptide repeat protein [Deltaproteobacteria bacterium]
MGDGATPNVKSGTSPVDITPLPAPLTEDQKQVLTEDHKSPAPSAAPPDDAQLKKITAEVSSMGVKLPGDMVDEKGNIKPEKLSAAKDFIKAEADKRRGTDVGAAARLLKRAISLDPKDEKLRLETAKVWLEWNGQTKDVNVRKVQLEEAFGFIGDIDTQQGKNPEFAKVKYDLAQKLVALNVGHLSDKDASKWLGIAVENATTEQVQQILKDLKEYPHPELLDEMQDPYLFIAAHLIKGSRFDEARAMYTLAVNEATDPKQKETYLRFFHAFDGVDKPYSRSFDGKSNPVVQELYEALRKQGITDAALKGADGKAEHPADDKIWPGDVLRYINEHYDSKKVQGALKTSKLEIPPGLKKDIKEKGFSQAMADYHAAEAKKLARSDRPEDKQLCSTHLRIAVGLDGDNVERRLRFGQALMREGKFADAADAFEQVRRRQPMNTEVLLDLARAQLGAGEPKKALAALDQWDNGLGVSLRSPEKITEVDGLRRKAGSMHLADLLKVYDGLKGGGSRDERQRLLDEMSECPKATNMERFAVLKRQRDFFAAEVKRPGADSIDIRHAQEDLDKLDKRIETLRDDLKEVARVKSGEAPTLEQLDAAKTAAEISRSYGDLSDLLRYNDLVKSATPDVMDAKAKLDAYGEVYRALRAQGGRTSETDAIGRQIQELAQDYLSSSKAKDYLEQVVMNGSGPVLDLLSAEGLKKLETEVDAGNKALAEAGKKTDVKEKRGCLLEALKHFGALGDNAKAREIAGQLESTIPADMSRVDKLQIYGLMSGVLKDSRVTVEDGKNSTLTKEYQDKGSALAVEIIGRGNMGPPHGAERVKELMVAKAFCDSVGDIPNATTATLRLSGIQGELLADPMFTDPKLASDPAKAKERLETARLVVQIDLERMGGKLNTAAKIVQEISEGKRPESDRALVSDDMKRIADHIGIWQDQLALAKDLPVDERLAEGTKIAASLGRLKILTQGDKPLLKPEDISSVNGKFETTMSEIFADCMEQGPGASEEDKKMAADVVSDMKGRLKLDIEDGNMIWASQLDPKKLIQFAETAQNARKLMADAKARGPLDPTGTQRYLQAAALYAQIGCKDRVKEAMRPVEVFEAGLTTPSDKIGLDFSIAQIYTMAGMNKEANGILYRAAQMNTGAYPLDVQDLATLAQGMIHLNNGDTDKARAELEKLPDNKTAQELLRGISAGGRELRINQSMQIARSWLFSLEEKNMSPEKQALMEQGIDDVLHKAKTLMLDGKATDFRDALTKAAREAPAAVQGYIQSNLISTGNDSLPNDPQGKIMAAITVMADPNVSDKDAAEAAIKLSDGLILAGERYYGNAGQIAKFMVDNPYVGAEAKKIIDEKIPEWVKMGAIFSGLKGLACATPPGAFCMIFFAGSEAEANEAMVNSLISIGSFGIARGLAVGAEALWVAKMATVIESPVIMGVTKFGVRTVTEAAAFPVAGALLTTALTGKVDHWQPEHFKKEFLSMLVTFTLLHGAGIPLSKFTGRAERSVLEAQEALKVARQTSQGVEAAESALNRAMAFEKMAKGVGWVGNVAAFTGAEYVNESLGLKADEKGVPFWMKFLGCAVTDAQMKVGGKIIDGVTNGKLTRIETNTAKIMQVHSELPKFNAAVGVGETSAPVMKAIQGRIVADPKFDPAKFLTEAQGTMKILEPALKDLPKDKQDQVRQGLLLEIAEGKLDTKLAQTLAKRVKAGQSEIVPNESGSGYDFVPGKKSIDAKKKEDQRQADAQQKSAQKRVDDAKKKSDDQAAAALQQQQEKAFQGREKARVAEFDKGFGFREAKRKDGAVIGIEKYDTKTDAVVETKTPPTKEDLESFQGYQKKQAAKQELRSGFEKGQRILPDPKDKGKFQLVDVNGEKVRDASKEELGQYLQFKKDARAFQAAEKLRTEAVQKILGERVAGLETEFDNGTVVRMKMKKA